MSGSIDEVKKKSSRRLFKRKNCKTAPKTELESLALGDPEKKRMNRKKNNKKRSYEMKR